MSMTTSQILEVLAGYGINPLEDDYYELETGEIGEIGEAENVYATSIDEVFGLGVEPENPGCILEMDDQRMRAWLEDLEQVIAGRDGTTIFRPQPGSYEPLEPHCAWYCPINFHAHGWGIYIRENCVMSHALDIARFVNWQLVNIPHNEIARHLLRSAFYFFFLHEQFHHKVESLGFRLLVSSGVDRYRPYKQNVYRKTFFTPDCLEESLANAESLRRLDEGRYVKKIERAIHDGLKNYIRWAIPLQPPGYQQGLLYVPEKRYRGGLYKLQSQVLDGVFPSTTTPNNWSLAPNMITALADINQDIYIVLPQGARPIFRPTTISPGATVSSRVLEGALTRHYGYSQAPGGKGSHVKLSKSGSPTIILPGRRATLSPGVVKHALNALGGHPISMLPELLEGRLRIN